MLNFGIFRYVCRSCICSKIFSLEISIQCPYLFSVYLFRVGLPWLELIPFRLENIFFFNILVKINEALEEWVPIVFSVQIFYTSYEPCYELIERFFYFYDFLINDQLCNQSLENVDSRPSKDLSQKLKFLFLHLARAFVGNLFVLI